MTDAFTLWQRFMARIDNDPWLCGTDSTRFCLFCDEEYPNHEDDCIFLAVWDMLTRATATAAPTYA